MTQRLQRRETRKKSLIAADDEADMHGTKEKPGRRTARRTPKRVEDLVAQLERRC